MSVFFCGEGKKHLFLPHKTSGPVQPPAPTTNNMKKTLLLLLVTLAWPAAAQNTLTLDSCRAMALRQNKSLLIGRTKIDKARYDRKAAHTNYLPKVSLTAGYMRTGDEISLLSDEQKSTIGSLGSQVAPSFQQAAGQIVQQMPELAPLVQSLGTSLEPALNQVGQKIVDAFHTDTRDLFAGTIVLTQPLYTGGKIRAYNRITHYAEDVAGQQLRADEQEVVLNVDQAYWQVVSLTAKKRLAEENLALLNHIDSDMQKMIAEGVATKANGLTVSVKVNEAEMALTRVDNGLSLATMLLCQLCGLPLDSRPRLSDAGLEDYPTATEADVQTAWANRPELSQLETAMNIYDEKVKIERSAALPQLALTGGYLLSNPNVFNGFERKFRGTWSVGVALNVPVWNWGENRYKVRSAKADAQVARYELAEAREKIELQVTQAGFQVKEAAKRLTLSLKNCEKAEENLRTAQAGFKEGAVTTSDVLAATTAWLQAHSEVIDARIDVKLTDACLHKALGTLH